MSNYSDLTKAVMRGRRLMQGGRAEDASGLQRQLAEVTAERDTLRSMLADERINRMLTK